MSPAARPSAHLLLATLLLAALMVPVVSATPATAQEAPAILVFSKTAAFRHSSIPDGIAAIQQIGADNDIVVDTTEEASAFTEANLANYDAVVWLSTTGDVLDDQQQAAFEDYIESGGGYAGLHAASDTEYSWEWYGGLVGAYFAGHPENQDATVHVADSTHPSTESLPEHWDRFDEWYNFQSNPRGDVHVLATLDESTYEPGSGGMGEDHPIAWCHYYNGGRSWYTGGGHTSESYTESAFVEHLTGGILWAAGLATDDCGGTKDANFQKVVLDADVTSPMGLQVAEDGRVFYIERGGQVRVIDPDTSVTSTAGTLQVHTAQENGLLGIELDPDFATNGWIYLYYSPDSELIDEPHQRLSRFTLVDGELDMASEQILLQVPHQREECCHSGGKLDFGPDGNLWISTGDDTSPGGAPGGYAPIDERPGNEAYDAQRSAANTNDLRGKLLRITPADDGSYTVPDGNLVHTDWAADKDTALIRPEIYGMGLRNPFRYSVDQVTGDVYLADYGPDAAATDPDKGIDGRVEWNHITEPGNYGWPYCHGGGAYIDYDYATDTAGGTFDCANPTNDSPNNTGLVELPPVIQPQVHYGRIDTHPVIGNGGAPMGGPAYHFDETIESDRQWPDYFDGTPIFYEWGQNRLYEFHLDESGELADITPLLESMEFIRPHDMVFGPHDGAMYLIEWGTGFGGNNPDAQVVRVDYTGGNENPIARVSASPRSGGVPLTVEFSSAGTAHPQGGALSYSWDFGDGATSTEEHPTHTYTAEGDYTAVLTVTDVQGRTGTANVTISVGNTAPDVQIEWPADGTVFTYGDEVDYDVRIDDVEDGSTETGEIDCADVTVELVLGHDDHGHPMQEQTGCEGSFVLEPDSGHTDTDRITYAIEARYTDNGSPEGTVGPLTGRDLSAMQPSRKQAEHYDVGDGVRSEDTADPLGGDLNMGWIEDGSSMTYENFSFANLDTIRFRVASPNDTSRIEVRKDTVDGQLLGVAEVPETGGFQDWDWAEATIDDPGETFDLVLSFRGAGGYLLNINWMDFVGQGAAGGPPTIIPTPTATLDPAAPNGEDGWYVSPVGVDLASEAGDEIVYRVGTSGDWLAWEGPVTLDADGVHTVEYRAVRGEDQSVRGRTELRIDRSAPTTTANPTAEVVDGDFTGTVEVVLSAEDATSGVGQTTYRVDGGDAAVYDGAFTVTGEGEHTVEYRSSDIAGNIETWQSVTFVAPSGPQPELDLSAPPPAGVVAEGREVSYEVTIDAADDIDCADVRARVVITHGDHDHYGAPVYGCKGQVAMFRPGDAGDADLLVHHLEATYAEGGFDGEVIDLGGASDQVLLRTQRVEAEHHDSVDIRTEETGDEIGGGLNVGWIQDGFTIGYDDVNLAGVDAMRFRLAGIADDGVVELRQGSADGPLLGTLDLHDTGGSQSYEWFETDVTDPGGPFRLVLVFTNEAGGYIANFNMFEFVGLGVGVDGEAPAVSSSLLGTFAGDFVAADGYDTGGHATLEVTADGTTLSVDLDGLAPASTHQAHLHTNVCGTMVGGHYQDNPAGPAAPPNELWLVDDPADPDAGFQSSPEGTASVAGTATWTARSTAQSVMVHGGELGLPRGCATLDTAGEPVEVVLDATDDVAVATVEYALDGGDWAPYEGPVTVSEPGDHEVTYRATDGAGNVSEVGTARFTILAVPATPVVTVDPGEPDGADGWYVSAATVTVAPVDPAHDVEVDLGGGWVDYTGPITLDADGTHEVAYRASNAAGTSEVGRVTVPIDATAPTVEVSGVADGDEIGASSSVEVTATVADATSGPAGVRVLVDGQEVATGDTEATTTLDGLAWALGDHTITVEGTDMAGNTTASERVVTIVTSPEDVTAIIDDLAAEGRLDRREARLLTIHLEVGMRLLVGGLEGPAVRAFERAQRRAWQVDDDQARDLLVTHLDAILAELDA